MDTITTDQAIHFTKDLNILYIEDDKEFRAQTKKILDILFSSTTTADNGVEALKIYKKEHFDIVISDIKLPHMNGVEFSKEIKKINPNQCIIIVSAYHDNEYLMDLINLNIRQFIQKPINIDNMVKTLYFASKDIVNEKMVEEYRLNLEDANKKLITKNEELNSLVGILDSKLLQIGKNSNIDKKNIDISLSNMDEKELDELKYLEIDIKGAAILINLSKNLSVENMKVLGLMFLSYSGILKKYDAYNELSLHMQKIGNALNNAPDSFIKRVKEISILLESFIYVLHIWRKNIQKKDIYKAIELHSSMINDINTIISIIDGTEDNINSEVDFFQ